jgi:SPP1 family predicted phage head-tail adaptor
MALGGGSLDRSLILRKRAVANNTLGEPVETFTDLATVRASKTDISDAEKVRAQQVGAEITTRFQIRWSVNWSDLNPKDRVACDLREYEVVGVKEIGRREGIEITACARADQSNLYS